MTFLDACDITNGSVDINENGIPDSCDLAQADLNLDGCIDGSGLGSLLLASGRSHNQGEYYFLSLTVTCGI